MVNRLWYCDVTQTSFVTSFWSIVLETFLRTLGLVTVFPPPYQLSCHSLFLIIESDSQHFHWLAFKKIFSYSFFYLFIYFCICFECDVKEMGRIGEGLSEQLCMEFKALQNDLCFTSLIHMFLVGSYLKITGGDNILKKSTKEEYQSLSNCRKWYTLIWLYVPAGHAIFFLCSNLVEASKIQSI